jgi:hypothetical protein
LFLGISQLTTGVLLALEEAAMGMMQPLGIYRDSDSPFFEFHQLGQVSPVF